tara:strand:+ start:927 stop:1235 length:309 start_codon:yes stop_codon:yes gene_type:complete
MTNISIINNDDFGKLIDAISELQKEVESIKQPKQNEWVSETEAMEILGGISKSTIQKFRKEGKLAWSQYRNLICYKRSDLMKFFEDHYTGNRNYVTSKMIKA